ncbi:MAG: KH domain-containing protein [Candidatus Pacebacteria bacterium]|nr:KH domain-containing protein [Candidatus Paceibacterota bacterium]
MVKDSEFVEYIVKSLVDNPNEVKIERKVDEMGVLITVDVGKDDMGKIIGRQGATAKAIRTLLRVVGMKNNARVNLKINEPAEMLGAQSGEGYRAHLDDVDAVMDGIKNI